MPGTHADRRGWCPHAEIWSYRRFVVPAVVDDAGAVADLDLEPGRVCT
jgi:hypothetical protein